MRLVNGRPCFEPRFSWGGFYRTSGTSDFGINAHVAILPYVIGSALGLVGLVSVYGDWVR